MKKRRKNYYRVIILNAEGTDPQNNVIALIWGSFLFHLKTTTTQEKYKRDKSIMASILNYAEYIHFSFVIYCQFLASYRCFDFDPK